MDGRVRENWCKIRQCEKLEDVEDFHLRRWNRSVKEDCIVGLIVEFLLPRRFITLLMELLLRLTSFKLKNARRKYLICNETVPATEKAVEAN